MGKPGITPLWRRLITGLIAATVAATSSVVILSPPLAVAAASFPSINIYVGYADSLRASQAFPSPWQGSSNTNFIGAGVAPNNTYDSGAVRLDNPSNTAITVQDVSVDLGSSHFDLWGSGLNLPAKGHLILAQTGLDANNQYNFDTSDVGTSGCTKSGLVPKVGIKINGITTTYTDTRLVLNRGGVDLGNCPAQFNESFQWELIGSGPNGGETKGGGSPSQKHKTVCQHQPNPVNCATGEFWHTFRDLAVPGRGMPLEFTRTYSSSGANQSGPLGFGWTDSYNMSLSVESGSGDVTVTEETGAQIVFTPTYPGFETATRNQATLVQNADGTYTFTRWNGQQFLFNASGQLVQESDRNGYTTTLAYNGAGQLSTVTDPAGRALSLAYTGSLLTGVTDSGGRTASFSYDPSSNLVSATDVNGGVTSFTYDTNHLMLTMTDPNGGRVTNVYDAGGRITSQIDPMNRTTSYSYNETGTTITDPNGNVEVQQYQNNELVSLTQGSGTAQSATWSYTYDQTTLGITSVVDPNGHTWTFTYDSNGNTLTATDPLNRTTTRTYDSLSDMTSETDPLSVTTSWSYDANGNLLSISRPLAGTSQARTTSFSYGDARHPGDVTSSTDPSGKAWQMTYDANGDLSGVVDPLGDRTTLNYDGIGRPTSAISPRGNLPGAIPSAFMASYAFNPFGDVTKVIDPLGHATTFGYDGDRNLTSRTDPAGNQTRYTFDADNELTRINRADGTSLSNTYDSNGNQLSQVNGLGKATLYGYNALNRRISSTDPANRTTSYAYDGAGNMVSLTDPSLRVTSYTYDAANELTAISYSDGKTPGVTYTYDANGRRATMGDGTGLSHYSFDSLNRLTQSVNGAGQTVGYGYDLSGRLTSLTYPNGQTVARTYDAAGRLSAVSDWLGHTTSFGYDADGNPVSDTYPNGTQASYTYDAADQLNAITDTRAGSTFASFTYTRDPNGDLLSDTSTGMNQPSQSYSYDQLKRLTGVNSSSYAYDAADNLTRLLSGSTLAYDAANQLSGMTRAGITTSFSYDAQGNRLTGLSPEGTAASYTYNQANRLIGFKTTPPPASGLIKGGEYFSLAARSDGTAWAWGYNVFGQLGNGTTTTSTVPVQVSGLVGVTAVAAGAGAMFSLALKNDGTVWAWGYNGFGQLGNGSTTNSSVPVPVNGVAGASAIAAGNNHGLAVVANGAVAAWGENDAGELGNGMTTQALTPVSVQGVTNVTAVAAGGMPGSPGHSMALESNGTVWTWGLGKSGQLGNGGTNNALTPVQVTGLSGVVAISANGNNSFALKNDGTVWAWGDNSSGQLGNTTAGKTSAVPVQVNISGVAGISNGADFGLAVKPDGTVWGWGDDASGQLGDGGACGKACKTPVQTTGLTGVTAVSGGYTHSLALTTVGAAKAWGQNGEGQLGNGTTTFSTTPVPVSNLGNVKQAPSQASYAYDGDGLRASKTVSGSTSQFAWNLGSGNPLLLTDGSSNYITGPLGLPIEQITGTTPLFIHNDQIGSSRILTDMAGSTQAITSYDPYGNLTSLTSSASGSASSPFGYASQYRDAETGLAYLVNRYYDAGTGQLMTRDPAVQTTRQPYSYVTDNPANFVDPMGIDGYQFDWNLGSVSDVGTPDEVMSLLQEYPGQIFPFSLGKCTIIVLGESCALDAAPGRYWPVVVSNVTTTSFTFCVLPGSQVEPPGSTITFTIYEKDGYVYLQQKAYWNIQSWQDWVTVHATEGFAWWTWSGQANNLRAAAEYAQWIRMILGIP